MQGWLRVPNLQKILTDSRFLSEAVEEERVDKCGEGLYSQSQANKYTRTNMNMHFVFFPMLTIFFLNVSQIAFNFSQCIGCWDDHCYEGDIKLIKVVFVTCSITCDVCVSVCSFPQQKRRHAVLHIQAVDSTEVMQDKHLTVESPVTIRERNIQEPKHAPRQTEREMDFMSLSTVKN